MLRGGDTIHWMALFDNKLFTEKSLGVYADILRNHLPRVKFTLEKDDAIKTAIDRGVLRVVRSYAPYSLNFPLDPLMRSDGSIDEDQLAATVAVGLAEPLVTAAQHELQPEEDDPMTRIDAGQLWAVHKTIPVPDTLGGSKVNFAEKDGIGLLGQSWYEMKVLKQMFMARTEWGLFRSGEIKQVARNISEQP